MRRAAFPRRRAPTFVDETQALDYISAHAEPLVVKASGLAAGKGAVVCKTRGRWGGRPAMLAGSLGDAGKEIVIEEFLQAKSCRCWR